MKAQTVVERVRMTDTPQRRGQAGHMAHVGRYAIQPVCSQLQAVVERGMAVNGRKVLCIGLKQLVCMSLYRIGHMQEYIVALKLGQDDKLTAGFLGLLEKRC